MKKWIVVFFMIPVVVLGWWLVSPLFIDKVVDEEPVAVTVEEPAKVAEDINQQVDGNQDIQEVALFRGSFVDGDETHRVSGDVKIEGQNIRIENLDATNGPDLFLYLVEEGQETKNGVNLGDLKGNKGNQNYLIPEDLVLKDGMRLVIWCKQFNVDFGYAELAAV